MTVEAISRLQYSMVRAENVQGLQLLRTPLRSTRKSLFVPLTLFLSYNAAHTSNDSNGSNAACVESLDEIWVPVDLVRFRHAEVKLALLQLRTTTLKALVNLDCRAWLLHKSVCDYSVLWSFYKPKFHS